MNLKTTLSFLLIICIISFVIIFLPKIVTKPEIQNISNIKEEKIIDDDFIQRVKNNDLTYENLQKIYSPKEIIEQNLEGEYDKINHGMLLIFKTDTGDTIKFFKNDYTLLTNNMIFISNKIILDGNLKIGVDKSILEQKFNKQIFTNSFIVSSLEGYINFTFLFENNKLVKIIYNVEYLD